MFPLGISKLITVSFLCAVTIILNPGVSLIVKVFVIVRGFQGVLGCAKFCIVEPPRLYTLKVPPLFNTMCPFATS